MRFVFIIVALFAMFCGVMSIIGCSGTAEERRLQFDAAIDQTETTRDAARDELDRRIADVKLVFDRQAEQLEAHIADLEAQLAAKPETAAAITPKIDEAKAIHAKIDATYNSTTKKLENITAEIFRVADEKIAALKAERESITSEDPGEQIAGFGRVITPALPPGLPQLIGGLAFAAISGIVSTIYQTHQKNKIKAAGVEAVGTMSTMIKSGAVKMDATAEAALKAAQSTAAKNFVKAAKHEYSDVLEMFKKPIIVA